MTGQLLYFDLPPETEVELVAAAPLLDLGYKPAEIAVRRRVSFLRSQGTHQ